MFGSKCFKIFGKCCKLHQLKFPLKNDGKRNNNKNNNSNNNDDDGDDDDDDDDDDGDDDDDNKTFHFEHGLALPVTPQRNRALYSYKILNVLCN